MSVFTSDDHGLNWRVARQIPGVRHIHGVYRDPYAESIWVTTGNDNDESAIWVAVGGRGTLVGAGIGALIVNGAKTYLTGAYPDRWMTSAALTSCG